MEKLGIKDARIDIKTTAETKAFLKAAAALEGLNMSSFIISAAMQHASEVIKAHKIMNLSPEDQLNFANLIKSSVGPTQAMEELRGMPRLKVRE